MQRFWVKGVQSLALSKKTVIASALPYCGGFGLVGWHRNDWLKPKKTVL